MKLGERKLFSPTELDDVKREQLVTALPPHLRALFEKEDKIVESVPKR